MAAKNLGIGIGLRVPHYAAIQSTAPAVDFFEIISENFMVEGGPPLRNLSRVLEQYPGVQHGVSLGIASAQGLDFEYLDRLKQLARMTDTPWLSDHLCWTRSGSHHSHDPLPVPYTEENATYIADKARIVQDFIERPFALENLSSYVSFKSSQMTEWEFYRRVIEAADIYMMLDVNNVYVSSVNHGFDPMDYLRSLPYERVIQVHVAGHTELADGSLLDTHNRPVRDEVWQLYRYVHQRTGGVSTILEWDADFLGFEDTVAQAMIARRHMTELHDSLDEQFGDQVDGDPDALTA